MLEEFLRRNATDQFDWMQSREVKFGSLRKGMTKLGNERILGVKNSVLDL